MRQLVIETWKQPDRQNGAEVTLRQLRRDYEHMVREFSLPDPLTVSALCEFVQARRKRPIQVLTMSMPAGGPVGLWVATRTSDYVVVEKAAPPVHRQHITLHELSHVLLEHNSSRVLTDNATQLLFPHLHSRTIDLLMARTCYDSTEEQQAETLASVLSGLVVHQLESDGEIPTDVSDTVQRLSRTLERNRRH